METNLCIWCIVMNQLWDWLTCHQMNPFTLYLKMRNCWLWTSRQHYRFIPAVSGNNLTHRPKIVHAKLLNHIVLNSGGYNFNSLCEILSHWKPDVYGTGKVFTVHRLDRLTSGLVLLAKSSALAGTLGKCIMQRDGCEKIYLAKVKGKFPLGLHHTDEATNDDIHPWEFQYCPYGHNEQLEDGDTHSNKRQKCSIPHPCEYGETCDSKAKIWSGGMHISFKSNEGKKQSVASECGRVDSYAGLGYWITDSHGAIARDASLQDLIKQCDDLSLEEMIGRAIGSTTSETGNMDTSTTTESWLWLNFACPCRIALHKNGICEAGNLNSSKDDSYLHSIKPAQTLLSLLSYDALSDTSVVLAKPVTGRTHQIRLHLQKLGHPIANDHCYGGELWFGDDDGKKICAKAREWLDLLDRGEGVNGEAKLAPDNSTNADTPVTDSEIYHAAANRLREDGESILDFVKKTCVWCARCRGVNGLQDPAMQHIDSAVFQRTLMEYLVRSQGIWLHALQYSLKSPEENGESPSYTYRTDLPPWAK